MLLTGVRHTFPVTLVHILEYENYDGYDDVMLKLRTHKVSIGLSRRSMTSPTFNYVDPPLTFQPLQTLPDILNKQILPTVQSRHSQLMSEFAFWPSSPPRQDGGVYELRSYQLTPGRLLEWENAWKRGLQARKRFVVSTRLVWPVMPL